MWNLIKLIISFFFGKRAGQAAAQEQAVESENEVAQVVTKAENNAPVNRATTVERLRNGPGI